MTAMPASSRLWAWSAGAALALAALLACARPAAAQDITATLTGMVTDHKGRALPGVTVSVKNGVFCGSVRNTSPVLTMPRFWI